MNQAVKKIIEIVKNSPKEVAVPKSALELDYDAHVTYTGGDVVTINIKGKLKSVSFSVNPMETYLTFTIETERGFKYVDYNIKGNFTCISWCFNGEEFNDRVDKNTPIKVLRQILKAIE